MKVKKVLNNNVAISHNDLNQEIVVMGKGLAFQKKVGSTIEKEKIEKIFILESEKMASEFINLLEDVPEVYVEVTHQIITYAKSKLSYQLNEYLYVALIDHISFAVEREKRGLSFENALLWEIKTYYKKEFEVALEALQILQKYLNIEFPEDEAGSIALHLVNSQLEANDMTVTVEMTEFVNDVLNMIKYYFHIDFDHETICYERFITHLRFFGIRMLKGEKVTKTLDEFLFEQVKIEYAEAYRCANRIGDYIQSKYNWQVTKDELLYLILHIHRLTSEK